MVRQADVREHLVCGQAVEHVLAALYGVGHVGVLAARDIPGDPAARLGGEDASAGPVDAQDARRLAEAPGLSPTISLCGPQLPAPYPHRSAISSDISESRKTIFCSLVPPMIASPPLVAASRTMSRCTGSRASNILCSIPHAPQGRAPPYAHSALGRGGAVARIRASGPGGAGGGEGVDGGIGRPDAARNGGRPRSRMRAVRGAAAGARAGPASPGRALR